jgi:hypothetical protein
VNGIIHAYGGPMIDRANAAVQKNGKKIEIVNKILTVKMGRFLFPAATACLTLCLSSASAQLSAVNNDGGDISLLGSSDSGSAATGGSGYLDTSGVQNFSFDGVADTGTLDSFVYGAGVDPANTLGGLTFVYALTLNANPDLLLGELQIGSTSSGSYWGSSVQMGYGNSTVVPPATGSLNLFSVLNFKWSPESTNSGAYYVVVGTSLGNYTTTTATVQDGGSSGALNVLAPEDPPVPAPEPSSATLLLSLFLGAVCVFRKAGKA